MPRQERPIGDGPYRTPPPAEDPGMPRWLRIVLALPVVAAVLLLATDPDDAPREPPPLDDVPELLTPPLAAFPPREPALPIATPLEPLLAADEPDRLTLLEPGAGAMRLRPGRSIRFRFNRPMVERRRVGDPVDEPPVLLEPRSGAPIRGTARWTSRSTLVYRPAASSWSQSREATLRVAPELRSLDGAEVMDEHEHVVVFDATPLLSSTASRRVADGDPLPLFFDNRVSPGELGRELFAYELGGGARNMPVALRSVGFGEGGYRVDLLPGRRLEAGARIAVAVAPRWAPWGGSSPTIVRYTIQPRPHIEGVGCADTAPRYGGCPYGPRPGRVVDIGPQLRMLASEALDESATNAIGVRPALPAQQASLDESKRVLIVDGEWAPGQVYEVRVGALRSAAGERLLTTPPLAVRSAGHAPSVRVSAGRFAYEQRAAPTVRFEGINVGKGAVLYYPLRGVEALVAALRPETFADGATRAVPLGPLAPEARANRWGAGTFRWRDPSEGRDATAAVLRLRPGAGSPHGPTGGPTLFVQQTDLAPTVRALPTGVLVWVTTLHEASLVPGAQVQLASRDGVLLGEGTTDDDGLVWLPAGIDLSAERFGVRVAHGEDAAVLVVEPGRAVGPTRLGVPQGGATPAPHIPRASVFSDRGAYRPGETLRVRAQLRKVEGTRVEPARDPVTLRLYSQASNLPLGEEDVRPTEYGSVSAVFTLPRAAVLGQYRAEVVWREQPAPYESDPDKDEETETITPEPIEHVVGSASMRVASFRQPTFRVDVERRESIRAREALRLRVDARYLFGAPIDGGALRWSLLRDGGAPYPTRWEELTFRPVDGHAGHGTVDTGEVALSAQGEALVEAAGGLTAVGRERLLFEAEVTDASGQTSARARRLTLFPATLEVGLERADQWVDFGTPLRVRALVLDNEDALVRGHPVQARILREGWHSWWEWHRGGSQSVQARRERERQAVFSCDFESAEALTGCEHTPSRPGTYVIEVRTRDGEGRETLASHRVYVAGPDEAPDRDPPGTPIALTPARPEWAVGETAALAFESPWAGAQALITVEHEGTLLHREQRLVESGGQTISVEITEEMVPSALVSVALVRPREGEPGERHDVLGPDLRFGATELAVHPGGARYALSIEAPERAAPGEEVNVTVEVRDAAGQPARAEVALWVVDEGTLRLTEYARPDPSEGIFVRRPSAFVVEDLRRRLTSRVEPASHRGGGDGGEAEGGRTLRPEDEILEPTPLWAPHLQTDSAGRTTATFRVPERSTEYRILALAMDERAGWGGAERSLFTTQPLVLQEALPRFVTRGDRFEAAAFVTNASDEDASATVVLEVAGEEVGRETLRLRPGQQERFGRSVEVREESEDTLPLRFRLEGRGLAAGRSLAVAPRGRWRRSVAFGSVQGSPGAPQNPEVRLRMPAAERGTLALRVASHPFVGLRSVTRSIRDSPWGGVQHLAATVMALAAELRLRGAHDTPQRGQDAVAETRERGRDTVDRLLALQGGDGSFGRWSARSDAHVWESALATHALLRGRAAGFEVPEDALARSLRRLRRACEGRGFGESFGVRSSDGLAYGLRVLREGREAMPERVDALFELRDTLGVEGLANLGLALSAEDPRRDTLALEVTRAVLTDEDAEERESDAPRPHYERRARVVAAVLELATASEATYADMGAIAGVLLSLADAANPFAWRTALDAAFATRALGGYAALFGSLRASPATIEVNGEALTASTRGGPTATYLLPLRRVAGREATLRITPADDAPVFFALEGEWAERTGRGEDDARGRGVSLHRRYETHDGRVLNSGDRVALGDMIRVRLFVYLEGSGPPLTMLYDPLGGGFEAVDRGLDTSPRQSLLSLLGMGPDDDAVDPRGFHAMRSLDGITHRAFEGNATYYYFDAQPSGLHEYTYAVRATTVGRFRIPPAQLDAAFDTNFVARSTRFEVNIDAAAAPDARDGLEVEESDTDTATAPDARDGREAEESLPRPAEASDAHQRLGVEESRPRFLGEDGSADTAAAPADTENP